MICPKCGNEMLFFKEVDPFDYWIERYICKKCKIEYRENYKTSGWFDNNYNRIEDPTRGEE